MNCKDTSKFAFAPMGPGGRELASVTSPTFSTSMHAAALFVRSIVPSGTHTMAEKVCGLSEGASRGNCSSHSTVVVVLESWKQPVRDKCFGFGNVEWGWMSKVWLLEISRLRPGPWLHALPTSTLGNLLDKDSLRMCTQRLASIV